MAGEKTADWPTAEGSALAKAPTGIIGLDEITGGGLPRGRATLVRGGPGAGKTLLGLEFLAAGARKHGEAGVLLSFEEPRAKAVANAASLGLALDDLERDGLLALLSFRPDASVAAGEFDLEPIFLVLDEAISRIGAKRVVVDTIEVLFGALGDDAIVRSEFGRLLRWLEERNVTVIVTGEQAGLAGNYAGVEEYVTDCVIFLDHTMRAGISTRRLRIVKYRGSAHGTNEYPFLISSRGLRLLPVTSIGLNYAASDERVSFGVPRLDHMLSGGLFRGSIALVSGMAGTGKTSLGAHLLDSACARGEQALWVLYEESPGQVLRNMRSIGLNLGKWTDAGLLHIWAGRPATFGPEAHLALLADLVDEAAPTVAVLDGIGSLAGIASGPDLTSMLARKFDLLKSLQITTLTTWLIEGGEDQIVGASSLVDSWLMLRNIEANGERNRLLYVLKSRGSAHSNQVREFILSDRGIELADVYTGPGGVLTGSARLAQEAAERDAAAQQAQSLASRRRQLNQVIADREAQLALMQTQLAAERAEAERMDAAERDRTSNIWADYIVMAKKRWADALSDGYGHEQP